MKFSGLLRISTLLALTGIALYGQSTGTIVGEVTDASNSAMPGIVVRLTQPGGSTNRDVTTNGTGAFQFSNIPVGGYSVKIEAQGFKAFEVNDIQLSGAEVRDLGTISLQVGALSDSVTVSAEAAAVETASSQRSQTVDGSHLEEIGLKGRDVYQLLDLLPGVVDTNTSRDISGPNSETGIVINGVDRSSTGHTLDGMQNQDNSNVLQYVQPNLDAIQEVRVQTSGFQAEFGRSIGGNINFVTKNGTSSFHGTGHWDHRNEGLNANSFFNNRANVSKSLYRYMIIGYSIGGPLYIPKKFNTAKNKYFFFVAGEWSRQKVGSLSGNAASNPNFVAANLPTAAMRSGDFSGLLDAKGVRIPVLNPTTRVAFTGNVIPPSLIDPTGQALVNLLAMPTGYVNPAPGQQYSANSIFQGSTAKGTSDVTYRFDANVTKKLSVFFRGSNDTYGYNNLYTTSPGIGRTTVNQPGYVLAGHATYVISPTLISESLVGFGYNTLLYVHPEGYDQYFRTSKLNPPTLFPIPTEGTLPGGGFGGTIPRYLPYLPQLTFGGGNSVGEAGWNPIANFHVPYANITDTWNATQDFTKIWGNHRFKGGIYIDKDLKIEPNTGNTYMGVFNFASNTNNPLDSGDGYANAMLGVFQTYTQSTGRILPGNFFWQNEGYLQDSWRITKRFNLDIGFRLVHNGSARDYTGTASNFYPSLYDPKAAPALYGYACKVALVGGNCPSGQNAAVNPLTGQLTFPALVGTFVNGSGNVVNGMHVNGLTGNSDYYEFPFLVIVPRIGFAWDVFGDGKTAIRGSAGEFTNRGGNGFAGRGEAPVLFAPQVLYSTINALPTLTGSSVYSPISPTYYNPKPGLEHSYSVSLGVQRDIGFKTVIDAAYVANLDRDAIYTTDINPLQYQIYSSPSSLFNGTQKTAALLRTRYPGLNSVTYSTSGLTALNYHALQFSAQHRQTHGLFFGVAYTFSKALGLTAPDPYHTGLPLTTPSGAQITLPDNRHWNYGPTANDRTQVLSINTSYLLPSLNRYGRVVKTALGGWTVTAISVGSTGAPYSPTCASTAGFPASDPTLTGQTARCQEVADPRAYTADFYNQFNTGAFKLAPSGTWGNTGLGILRQPSTINLDLNLDKTINITEKLRLRLRAQAFNVLNHTEYSTVGSTYSFNAAGVNTNSTTGQYTATNQPRQVALTIRLEY
jgi:hypothetical protein